MSKFHIRFLNRLSWGASFPHCFSWMLSPLGVLGRGNQSNVSSGSGIKSGVSTAVCLEEEEFSLFPVTSDSLRNIKNWWHSHVSEVDREGEGVGRRGEDSARVPRCAPGSWGQTWLPCPLFLSPSSWKASSSQGKAGSLQGEVNVILPSLQVFDFELTPEDMKAIGGLNRNIRYYEFLM